jgi:hypothetical protein
MNQSSTTPVLAPTHPIVLNASQAAVGAPVPPLQRLKIMPASEWEAFILEWVDAIRNKYTDVHQSGGAGDLGRDVIGFKAGVNEHSPWDNYQCKHYNQPLGVADVVAEIGKLLYHASKGEFCLPDEYFFLAPQGPSTALLKVLQKGTLKQELLDRWDTACRTTITKGPAIERSTVQAMIDAFDFARVSVVPPLKIIAGHQTTKYYAIRFGGGLPSRVLPIPKPPASVQPSEHVYIKKLLDAYQDEKNTPFPTLDAVQASAPDLAKHLGRSREQFFSAESLRAFSRDNVPTGTFEQLQDEIFDGIQDVYDDPTHTSGYQRVLKTVHEARILPITGNPLLGVMHNNDRAGICHQLANDDKMTWVHNQPPEKKP